MEKLVKFMLIFVVAFIVFFLLRRFMVKKYTKKLVDAVSQDEASFLTVLNGFIVKVLFSPYNRDFFKLNYYMAHEDDQKVEELVDEMLNRNLSKKQEFSILQAVFQYYLTQRNGRKTKKYQKLLLSFIDKHQLDQGFKDDVNLNVRIQIDGDIKTLATIEKNIKRVEGDEKVGWYVKKAYVLKCNDQLEEAKESIKKAIEFTSQPMQVSIFEKLLENNLEAL